MKLDKTTETMMVFFVSFVILLTAYYVTRVSTINYVSSEYHLGASALSSSAACFR